MSMVDFIEIRDLPALVRIGVSERERRRKQEITIHLRLHADVRKAAKFDSLEETVDYERVSRRVVEAVQREECRLIERLAETVARICVKEFGVRLVEVRIEKPRALKFGRAGVTIERTARDYSK